MHFDANGLEILAPAECRGLVAGSQIGRLAFADADSVTVLPVTYTVVGDHVVVRTTSGSKMAAASDRRAAALEVDDIDPVRHTGWSVLVRGRLELVADASEVAALDVAELRSWVRDGGAYLRLSVEEVTGRRMHSRARLAVDPRES